MVATRRRRLQPTNEPRAHSAYDHYFFEWSNESQADARLTSPPERSNDAAMGKLRVNCFTLSVDGYGAGPSQSRESPHLAISPVLLGSGEHLLSGLDLRALGYRITEHNASDAAMHVVLTRS
jgi:hypothetical protein